jgi:uncharacterized protein (TIGR03118 family)
MVTLVVNTQSTEFQKTNLVSDGSVSAAVIDPRLINPWGVSFGPTGPFWVSDNGSGFATTYDGAGNPRTLAGQPGITIGRRAVTSPGLQAITIATPPGQTTAATPTGQVFNDTGTFFISSGGRTASSVFIFATEDGTISGWSPAVDPVNSVLAVNNSKIAGGAVYKGLAIAKTSTGPLLYAANFRSGNVDVFNQNFAHVQSFTDDTLSKGYAPFNVAVLDNHLFVSFALQNAAKHDDVAGAGHGFVDEFNLNGTLLKRVASRGPLDSPWGMAIAPTGFGKFAHDLLVGNFGDGTINVFNPTTDQFLGKLSGADGTPIKIGDLWSLVAGNNGPNSDPTKVYFTAGLVNEAHGLFGSLGAVNDPTHATTVSVHSSHALA